VLKKIMSEKNTQPLRQSNTVSEVSIDNINAEDVHTYQHHHYGQESVDAVFMRSTSPLTRNIFNRRKRSGNPEFSIEANRLETYDDWPRTARQTPVTLSDAGFYYTGSGDRVICFSCNGGLKDWEENDDPWEQHAMWYEKCEYLKLMKGDDFIKTTRGASQPSTNAVEERQKSTTEKELSNELKESKLCLICCVNEYNTTFLPCGHVIACAKCASSLKKCPSCRRQLDKVVRIYFC
jgi:baculoviral IAP repeat-containing protein 7/8